MKILTLIFTLILVTVLTNAQTIPTDGLIAWYDFNGNCNDQSGIGNNGVSTDIKLTTDRFGNENGAYEFNGSTSFIKVQNTSSLDSVVTYCGWVYSHSSNNGGLLSNIYNHNSSSNYNYNCGESFLINNSTLYVSNVSWIGNYKKSHFTSVYNININEWYFFTVTFDFTNQTEYFYINGEKIGTYKKNIVKGRIKTLYLGNSQYENTFFNGKLDDIRLYDCVLTNDEVKTLYLEQNYTPNIVIDTTIVIDTITMIDTITETIYDTISVVDYVIDTITITVYDTINCNTTTVNDINYTEVKVYPNPSSNYIKISGTDINTVNILDTNGRKILTSQNDYINISHLKNGLYFVEIIDIDNKRFVKKLSKN